MSALCADQYARKRLGGGSANMPAVGAGDSGEHDCYYRRSGRGCKSVKRARQKLWHLGDVRGDARRSWITASEHCDMAFAGSTFSVFAPTPKSAIGRERTYSRR
jgi:hypothetical protein